MTNKVRASLTSLLLLCAVSACGSSQFSADGAPSGGDGGTSGSVASAGDAGSPDSPQGGLGHGGDSEEAGTSGSSGSAGLVLSSAGVSGKMSAGSGGSSGGSAGSASAGSGGTAGTVSDSGTGGTIVTAGAGGASGSGGTNSVEDPKYSCQEPASSQDQTACMNKVCSNLGYQCGHVENACLGSRTPCGILAVDTFDCQVYNPLCPAYDECDGATPKCDNQCVRLPVSANDTATGVSVCNERASQTASTASFRYRCGTADPGANSVKCAHDTPNAGASTWCCPENVHHCTVKFLGTGCPQLPPVNNTHVFSYQCQGDSNPDPSQCGKGKNPNQFCCATSNIE